MQILAPCGPSVPLAQDWEKEDADVEVQSQGQATASSVAASAMADSLGSLTVVPNGE